MFDDALLEFEDEYEDEFDDLEVDDFETDMYEGEEEFEYEYEYEDESPFSEADEMDLAAELLTVSDDAELEQFIGKLFRRAKKVVRRVRKSPVFRRLAKQLKPVLRKAISKGAARLGIPGGADLGAQLGQIFGLELEGLSPEDQEFEVARQAVRLAGDAVAKAAAAPPSAPPPAVAKAAIAAAVRKHAPGLGRGGRHVRVGGGRRSGRWVRRGRRIIVLGA